MTTDSILDACSLNPQGISSIRSQVFRIPLLPFALASALGLVAGCSGDPGYTPTPSDESPTPGIGTPTPGNTSAGSTHCGDITANQTWTLADSPHTVTCDVYIQGPNAPILTLEPGIIVRFESNRGLYIAFDEDPGGLVALGTLEAPILLTSAGAPEPGAWSGISAKQQALDSSLKLAHTTLQYAGGAYVEGALNAQDAVFQVNNVTLEASGQLGFSFRASAAFASGSSNLVVKGSTEYAGTIHANSMASLPTGDYTDNGLDAILITEGDIDKTASWQDPGVPIHVDVDLYVQGPTSPVLTLEAGVTLAFGSNRGLYVAYDGDAGGLIANGTSTDPVTFTAIQSTEAGHWSGVSLADASLFSSLTYTRLSYGGGAYVESLLDVTDAELTVDHVDISDCADYCFYFDQAATFGEGSTALTATGSTGHAGRIDATAAHTLPTGDYTGNTIDVIQLGNGDIKTSATWRDPGIPFRASEDLYVQGPAGPILTLEAGITLQFESGRGLYVAFDGDAGGLILNGTESLPVLLTAGGPPDPGFWSGVSLSSPTLDAQTRFDHFVIEYGGGAYLNANLVIKGASPTLNNGVLRHSQEYGLCIDDNAYPVLNSMSYTDNALGSSCE